MIINGDSFEEVKTFEDNSIDALVTDPPYGMSNISHTAFMDCMTNWCSDDDMYLPKAKGFMNKSWDGFVPPPGFWKEVLRVLKPGAYGLVFASSRTQDLMGLSLRIAGFEIRDCVTWLYGSGFPKSHDISKAMDKKNGTLKVIGQGRAGKNALGQDSGYNKTYNPNTYDIVEANSEEAKQWEGWGTALKPSYEPALLIRKPFKGSVASNVLEWGVGGINIDGCRIGETKRAPGGLSKRNPNCIYGKYGVETGMESGHNPNIGRFPSNTIMNDAASSLLKDESRFFYTAKASSSERSAGIKRNIHPTVKPIEIMRYLCRLITPPNGLILEPFLGSGTTAIAAEKEGFNIIGIEREKEYYDIAQARIKYWSTHDHAMTPQNPPDEEVQLTLF
jgi:site-specific DNA-methyltransferase (adenine-specific)